MVDLNQADARKAPTKKEKMNSVPQPRRAVYRRGGSLMRNVTSERRAHKPRRSVLIFILGIGIQIPLANSNSVRAASAGEIDRDVSASLKQLQAQSPQVGALMQKAVGILVFPKIIKGGLVIGGQYGEGALRVSGKTTGYYAIAAASFGLQAGGQRFGYALLFMNSSALDYLQ
jgi:hypothetical protein